VTSVQRSHRPPQPPRLHRTHFLTDNDVAELAERDAQDRAATERGQLWHGITYFLNALVDICAHLHGPGITPAG
jgi:hypothetical protein